MAISALKRILLARKLLFDELSEAITDIHFDELLLRLTIRFKIGLTVYIQFNDFNEYSYHIQFTQKTNDFLRYDNYDDHWDVPSKPHHFHQEEKRLLGKVLCLEYLKKTFLT